MKKRENNLFLGKIPPQDLELEKAVLGAIMLDSEVIPRLLSFLKPSSFYLSAHQHIFGVMVSLFKDRAPIDILTVIVNLRKNGVLEEIGGPLFITALTQRIASTANIEYHARIIEQYAIKRRLIVVATNMLNDSFRDDTDPLDLLEAFNKEMLSPDMMIQGSNVDPSLRFDKTVEMIENAMNGVITGYSSGVTDVDNLTGGIHQGEFTVVAARPGMGKTAFALHIARSLAISDVSVYWLQLEMSEVQMGIREIAAATAIPMGVLREGKISQSMLQHIKNEAQKLKSMKLYVDTDSYMDVNVLRAKAALAISEYKAQVFIIDYLQLADIEVKSGMNYTQAVGKISRMCKLISKQYNIPVIALSQLSREVEKRGNKRPQLSDLRDSGSIEQDADNVWFLFRPEYYGIERIEMAGQEISSIGLTELIVAKQRQGPVGSAYIETKIDINRYGRTTYTEEELTC